MSNIIKEVKKRSNGYFYIIPSALMEDDSVTYRSKNLYGILSSLVDDNGICFPSNKWLSEKLKTNSSYVSTLLTSLEQIGWVEIINKQTKWRKIRVIFQRLLLNNSKSTFEKNEKYLLKNSKHSSNKSSTNSNISCRVVYDYYCKLFNRDPNRYRFLEERKLKIQARLKTWKVDDIKLAIKNASLSKFHTGQNDSGWVADISYICKNDDKLETLINLKPNGGGVKSSNPPTDGKYSRFE